MDASALAALVFGEQGAEKLAARLAGVSIHAPTLLKYEMTQIAVNKARGSKDHGMAVYQRLAAALRNARRFTWHEVQPVDVALLAGVTGLSTYDASYMWLAGWLEADLITLDRKLAAATGFEVERE